MPFASIPAAEVVTRHDRRRIFAVIGALVLVVAGIAIWVGVRQTTYDTSKNGCITVNLPGVMGGEIIHACGSKAKATCQEAWQLTNQSTLLIRPECQRAGIAPDQQASGAG